MDNILPQSAPQEQPSNIPPATFYVYTLAYPDRTPFYAGKGKGNRINDHEQEARRGVQSHKCRVIRQIWVHGGQVVKQKVAVDLTEEQAFQEEIRLIALYKNLTNKTIGGEGRSIERPGSHYSRICLEIDDEILSFIDWQAARSHSSRRAYIEQLVCHEMEQFFPKS